MDIIIITILVIVAFIVWEFCKSEVLRPESYEEELPGCMFAFGSGMLILLIIVIALSGLVGTFILGIWVLPVTLLIICGLLFAGSLLFPSIKQNDEYQIPLTTKKTKTKFISREPIPEDVRFIVWRRDNEQCVKCGSKGELQFDHIIPVSKGGGNSVNNIQILCGKCNREKSNKI